MQRTRFSLILVLLSAALAAIACEDNEGGVTPSAGSGGTSHGGHGGGGSSGKGGAAGASAGAAAEAGAAGISAAGQAGAAEAGSGGMAGAPEAGLHLYVGCSVAEGTLQSYLVSNGTFTPLPVTSTGGSISNATFNQAEDLLYVAHAVGTGPAGRVTTYARNRTSGALTPIGTPADVPFTTPSFGGAGGSGGSGGGAGLAGSGGAAGLAGSGGAPATNPLPQTLTLDANEGHIAIPNYGSGNVYVYGILPNGSLGAIVSADAGGLNAHHAVFSNNHEFMLVPYLGSNLIKVYAYQQGTGNITLDSTVTMPDVTSKPRHLALHANGSWLYAINEMTGDTTSTTGSVDFFSFDQASGALTHTQTYPVPLPSGYTGLKNGSEIALAPSGKFLYVSMRLDNVAPGSLVVYAINASGGLSFVEQQSSRGATPRQFSLSSDGKLLIVGNQNSQTIELFSVDTTSGALSFVAEQTVCVSPRFARFAQIH